MAGREIHYGEKNAEMGRKAGRQAMRFILQKIQYVQIKRLLPTVAAMRKHPAKIKFRFAEGLPVVNRHLAKNFFIKPRETLATALMRGRKRNEK